MVGSITSQGDRAMRSNLARSLFSLDGSGITIGVISDSFNALNGAIADALSGDLPGAGNRSGRRDAVRVLSDLPNGSDEGRAILQIIHDIAPGAKLLFHTTGGSERSFAAAVRRLTRAGADIIVDDIGLSTSPFFQDGISAQAVNWAGQQGVLYFSSSGNDGTLSYESQYRPGETFTVDGITYEAHDFDASAGLDLFQDIQITDGALIDLILNWDQPLGRVANQLDLFLLDRPQLPEAGGVILARSTAAEIAGTPSRRVTYSNRAGRTGYLVIARQVNAAEPVPGLIKWISFANSADFGSVYEYLGTALNPGGGTTVYGQANAREAIAVGAVYFGETPSFRVNPPILESFTSRGGSPILFSSTGDRLPVIERRTKPEIAAPDGVSTTMPRFDPFFGTSAAAPHAAAAAALMLQRAGGAGQLTAAQVRSILQNTAIAVQPADQLSQGIGLIDALSAVLQSFTRQIVGSAAADTLAGSRSADNITGLDGNDVIRGLRGFDALVGGRGNDILIGNDGNDYLTGGSGSDRLVGGHGDDYLAGNVGNDRLLGGAGNNTLIGDRGRDLFVLARQGKAVIRDFQDGKDKLALSDNLNFSQLAIAQRGFNTTIVFEDRLLAVLVGVGASLISRADFG